MVFNIASQPEVRIYVFEFSFADFGLGLCCAVGEPYMTWPQMAWLPWKHHKELTHWGRDKMAVILKCIFLNENVSIAIKISLKFVPKGQINNIPALIQTMAWRRPGVKPLSEPMMVSLPTHIPQHACHISNIQYHNTPFQEYLCRGMTDLLWHVYMTVVVINQLRKRWKTEKDIAHIYPLLVFSILFQTIRKPPVLGPKRLSQWHIFYPYEFAAKR